MPKVGREKQNNRSTPYEGFGGRAVQMQDPKKVKAAEKAAAGGSGGNTMTMPLNKSFGQHLLRNPGILEKIVEASELKSSDTVLEIGPGTGNLTMRMLPHVKKLVAIELDTRMVAEVRKRAHTEGRMNLEVIQGDALRTQFPKFDACVANLPYQISSAFTFKVLAHRPLYRCAVLMFQYEFAERLVASVGEPCFGRLALNVQLFAVCTRVCKVARGSFNPPPKVDSMVVKLVPRGEQVGVDFGEWDGLLRICFNRKRKILHALFKQKWVLKLLEENYKTWCALKGEKPSGSFKEKTFGILTEIGFSERRAITLCMEEYLALLLAFNKIGIHFSNGVGTKSAESLAADIDTEMDECADVD